MRRDVEFDAEGSWRTASPPWRCSYRHAISCAQTLPEVDAGRIGVWGSSYSGAHALVLGAIDNRVKCVAAQVPLVTGKARAPAWKNEVTLRTVEMLMEYEPGVYVKDFDAASGAARDWFLEHLGPSR